MQFRWDVDAVQVDWEIREFYPRRQNSRKNEK